MQGWPADSADKVSLAQTAYQADLYPAPLPSIYRFKKLLNDLFIYRPFYQVTLTSVLNICFRFLIKTKRAETQTVQYSPGGYPGSDSPQWH